MAQHHPSAYGLRHSKPGQENKQAPSFVIPIFKLPLVLYRLRLGWRVALLSRLFGMKVSPAAKPV